MFPSFPQRVQNTTDTLLDLTGRNVTDFLVKTYQDSGRTRYRSIHVNCVQHFRVLREFLVLSTRKELK